MLANGKSTENFQNQSKFRMSILVIIPARSGSRRLKNKNKKKLHDMPLVEHTIKFAIKNKISKNILLTTDDKEILKIGLKYRNLKTILRPSYLSRDISTSISFTFHAINWFKKLNRKIDCIILLQPTSPYRKISTLNKMLKIFSKNKESILSITKKINNSNVKYFTNKPLIKKKDTKEFKFFKPTGSIYINSIKNLKKYKNFINIKSLGYVVSDPKEIIDIDTIKDFNLAKKLLKK